MLILEIGYDQMLLNEESRKILSTFPEEDALIFALNESISTYWPQLALDWIDSRQMEISASIREALAFSYTQKWAIQSFKHRIKKLLK